MDTTIAVIGTGYVGLTTGACFSSLGHTVICVDIDESKVDRLRGGEIPIHEPGLEEIVREGLQAGRLSFTTDVAAAARQAQFAYLCVPTPQGSDGSADLTYLEAAARQIAPHLPPEAVVVNKSTVPVGSTRKVEQALGRSDLFVVSNPEFLREGSAVHDFLNPDRVVIGSDDQGAAIRVASLYLGVPAPLMVTDPASAETIKYASNAFLAMKLSFVNAVAALCEAVGADADDVMLGMGYDTRIGNKFLRPGPGWGGSCFLADETVLVRRGWRVGLRTFEQLAAEVEALGVEGLEVLAWDPALPVPEYFPVSAFTVRHYDGDVVEVRTRMGRRLTVTADHPFVACDGLDPEAARVVEAAELTESDWLPVAQGAPVEPASFAMVDIDQLVGDCRAAGAIPDRAWFVGREDKRALLRGLWDGDGSWSHVNGGPSVTLEYGTVSRELADGMLRLLGELGIVASVRQGRSAKAMTDAYFLAISGADQVEEALFLLPDGEAFEVRAALGRQKKRTRPNGYRRLGKSEAWVRVTGTERRRHTGPVYSLEVPGPHTVVTTNGLIAHNCFPKDTRALQFMAREAGYDFDLLDAVLGINDDQFDRVTAKITEAAGGALEGTRVGVWGLTFKANTDDRRESPAVEIARRLVAAGAEVRAYDPTVRDELPEVPEVVVCVDPYAACDGAGVLAVLTEWDEFKWVDLDKVADAMAERRIVDARNLLDRGALLRRGFSHQGIGR